MSRPEMKHFLSIALFLLTVTLGIDAQAQWRVVDSYDQWGGGGKNEGEQLAVSEDTRSVNGTGKQVSLRVTETSSGCFSSADMADRTPINLFLVSGDRNGGINIPMQVNGIEQMASGFVGGDPVNFTGLSSGSKDDLPADRYGNFSESKASARAEQVSKWLAMASTFKIILPTREYGMLIYEFDMTGAREAIQTVCPSLF